MRFHPPPARQNPVRRTSVCSVGTRWLRWLTISDAVHPATSGRHATPRAQGEAEHTLTCPAAMAVARERGPPWLVGRLRLLQHLLTVACLSAHATSAPEQPPSVASGSTALSTGAIDQEKQQDAASMR
jgi:hypothetical protein